MAYGICSKETKMEHPLPLGTTITIDHPEVTGWIFGTIVGYTPDNKYKMLTQQYNRQLIKVHSKWIWKNIPIIVDPTQIMT